MTDRAPLPCLDAVQHPALVRSLARIALPDANAAQAAARRQTELTKPPRSLGRLESLVLHWASITGNPRPRVQRPLVLVAAADHGVAARGVSAFPQSVTAQMVANFLSGGAAISILAARAGAHLCVVDAGLAAPVPGMAPGTLELRAGPESPLPLPRFLRAVSGRPAADISAGPAFTRNEALGLLNEGASLAARAAAAGADALALGEMGIGNSTSAAALTALFLELDPLNTVGLGSGVDSDGLARKRAAVDAAIQRARSRAGTWNTPQSTAMDRALDMVTEAGGAEILFLAGAMIGGAASRLGMVLDGYISTAAALVACAMESRVAHYLVASHVSREPGHRLALKHLKLEPLLDLDLCLGEASGAALALPLIGAALDLHDRMATFESAAVATGRAALGTSAPSGAR